VNAPLLAFTLASAVSAALAIRASLLGLRPQLYLFKPLTTSLILLSALLAPPVFSPLYRGAICVGLFLSLLGDVYLMLPSDRFIAGLVCFLLAHVSYATGFAMLGWPRLNAAWLIPYALYGVGAFQILNATLGRLRLPVAIYLVVILTMAWLATAAHWAAALGAVLFVISDSVLAYEKFVRAFAHARWMVLGTYWAAQWLIALSVWMS
jgi:uncharacterized membrane protein YhhN